MFVIEATSTKEGGDTLTFTVVIYVNKIMLASIAAPAVLRTSTYNVMLL